VRGDDLKLHMEVGVQEHLDHILGRPVLQDHPIHREETVTDVQCSTPGRRQRGNQFLMRGNTAVWLVLVSKPLMLCTKRCNVHSGAVCRSVLYADQCCFSMAIRDQFFS